MRLPSVFVRLRRLYGLIIGLCGLARHFFSAFIRIIFRLLSRNGDLAMNLGADLLSEITCHQILTESSSVWQNYTEQKTISVVYRRYS